MAALNGASAYTVTDLECELLMCSEEAYQDFRREAEQRQRRELMSGMLPESLPHDNEAHVMFRRRHEHGPQCVQTTSFLDLPPELRNRIYEYSFQAEDNLVVASPFIDEEMMLAVQPSITRVSRQLRNESLAMFYAESTFTAYISGWDIDQLARWVDCITSGPSPSPKVKVHVKLLDRIVCEYQVLLAMNSWIGVEHTTVHLAVHNSLVSPGEYIVYGRVFDQRKLFAEAVDAAERLAADRRTDWTSLKNACGELMRNWNIGIVGCTGLDERQDPSRGAGHHRSYEHLHFQA